MPCSLGSGLLGKIVSPIKKKKNLHSSLKQVSGFVSEADKPSPSANQSRDRRLSKRLALGCENLS